MSGKNYKVLDDKILYLSTEANCTKLKTSENFNVEFSWNIPSITIDEFAKLKVFTVVHTGPSTGEVMHTGDILTMRLKDVLYNNSAYYSSDNTAYPIIWTGTFLPSEPTYWDPSLSGIHIIPQTLNKITLICTNFLQDNYHGFHPDLKFVIGISIEQYDLKLSEINNPYK